MPDLTPAAPLALGVLLHPEQVIDRYFGHLPRRPTVRWVVARFRHLPRERVGHLRCWWSADIERELATRAAA